MARRDPNSIRGRIRAIAVGESDDFPMKDRDTVRAAAYDEPEIPCQNVERTKYLPRHPRSRSDTMNHNLPPVITLDVRTIEILCECAALRAVSKFAQAAGMEGKEISERAAFRKFNESRIKHWVQEGRLSYRRLTDSDRSKKMYKVIDIMNLILEDGDNETKTK